MLVYPSIASHAAVCADCETQPFDPKELKWALITLAIVTSLFLAVCTCRCYPKFKEVCTTDPAERRARFRARLQLQAREVAARRASSMATTTTSLPGLQNAPPASKLPSSSSSRTRKGVVNSLVYSEPATISQFPSPGRVVVQERKSDRRRKSYPRSIRCSSSIPTSSELFSVPETHIAVSSSRQAVLPVTRRFGSAQLTNALLSPNAIVRHSRQSPGPTSSPCHHHHRHQIRDKQRKEADVAGGTFAHHEFSMSMQGPPPTPASPTVRCIQPETANNGVQEEVHVTRTRDGSPMASTERRCSQLETIDPAALQQCQHHHHHHHYTQQTEDRMQHNINNSSTSGTQQEISSSPRILNLAHQTPGHEARSRGSSPRNSLQFTTSGKDAAVKVRFEEVT